jgi:hypothetical protein
VFTKLHLAAGIAVLEDLELQINFEFTEHDFGSIQHLNKLRTFNLSFVVGSGCHVENEKGLYSAKFLDRQGQRDIILALLSQASRVYVVCIEYRI